MLEPPQPAPFDAKEQELSLPSSLQMSKLLTLSLIVSFTPPSSAQRCGSTYNIIEGALLKPTYTSYVEESDAEWVGEALLISLADVSEVVCLEWIRFALRCWGLWTMLSMAVLAYMWGVADKKRWFPFYFYFFNVMVCSNYWGITLLSLPGKSYGDSYWLPNLSSRRSDADCNHSVVNCAWPELQWVIVNVAGR